MALSEIDRSLLKHCLKRKPRSWEDFVDRFLGLVIHVINHTAQSRSIRLSDEDTEDLAAEVFLTIISNDFAILRRFRGDSSLATYLTVVARRVVVRELLRKKRPASLKEPATTRAESSETEQRIANVDEVERLLGRLKGSEREVVRMYHLEGRSYAEISKHVGMPENSVGPTLTRARAKMRRAANS